MYINIYDYIYIYMHKHTYIHLVGREREPIVFCYSFLGASVSPIVCLL